MPDNIHACLILDNDRCHAVAVASVLFHTGASLRGVCFPVATLLSSDAQLHLSSRALVTLCACYRQMPKLHLGSRSYPIASDDFVLPGYCGALLRLLWVAAVIACIVAVEKNDNGGCR